MLYKTKKNIYMFKNNNNNNNNYNYYKFNNFSNFFSFRNFAILGITIALSFTSRCLIIYFYTLDLTQFSYFFIVSMLVSFIRPLTRDLFDIYLDYKLNLKDVMCLSRNGKSKQYKCKQEGYNRGYQESRNMHKEIDPKDKIKRRLFWFLWKQHTDKFYSYKEFNKSWDINHSIREEIKKDIKHYINVYKLRRIKLTVSWFWNPKK